MDPVSGQPTDDEILSEHQTPPAGATPAAPAAPQEPAFNPQDFGYTFRNETVYPRDRKDALELFQLGHSYRANKSKWEQDRQALSSYEAKRDVYQQYDKLSEALQQNPEFASELKNLAQKYSGQPQPQNPSTLPPEVLEMRQQLAEIQERRADDELKSELDGLERSNPNYDWRSDTGDGTLRQQLLRFMHDKKVFDPAIALNAMMYKTDLQRAKMDAERKAADELAKQRRQGVVPAGTQAAPSNAPRPIDHKNMSYSELEDLAIEELSRR